MTTLAQPGLQTAAARKCGRPLQTLEGFASLAKLTVEGARRLVDRGAVEWAWDLSLVPGRRLLRILPECIEDALAGRKGAADFKAVLNCMFPNAGGWVRAAEVAYALNVSRDFVCVLTDRRELEALTSRRPGRGGSAQVSFESFFALLQRRRYPDPKALQSECGRSLVSMSQAAKLAGCSPEELSTSVEEGKLGWCFAIGISPTDRRIKILPASLEAFQQGRTCTLEWEDALALMLPQARPAYRVADVCRLLQISPVFLKQLVQAKELVYVSKASAGAFGVEGVTAESLTRFLRQRRFPQLGGRR